MSEVFRNGDYVNVDVKKTGDNSSLHSPVIKARKRTLPLSMPPNFIKLQHH